MDMTKSRCIGKSYAFYLPIAYVLLALLIIGYIVIAAIYWTMWSLFWSAPLWWVNILPPLGIGFWIFMFAVILKNGEDKKTKARTIALYMACEDINRTYLSKSDVKTSVGPYSAWLEIGFNPNMSKIKQIERI